MHEALVCKNVTVNGRRTSMRMEPTLWTLLDEIAEREGLNLNALVSKIERTSQRSTNREINLTASVRLFVMGYYRDAATEEGHRKAGHGKGLPLDGRRVDGAQTDEDGRPARVPPCAPAPHAP